MGEGARCPWAKTEHEILYHDTEWCLALPGRPGAVRAAGAGGLSGRAELEADSGAAGSPAGGLRGF
ncbi:MAG: hypothetical protein ACLRNQ_19595 [Flavonifractor plautii]